MLKGNISNEAMDVIVFQFKDLLTERKVGTGLLAGLFPSLYWAPSETARLMMEKFSKAFNVRVVYVTESRAKVERFLDKFLFPYNSIYGVSCSAELEYMVDSEQVLALMTKSGVDYFGRVYNKIEKW